MATGGLVTSSLRGIRVSSAIAMVTVRVLVVVRVMVALTGVST